MAVSHIQIGGLHQVLARHLTPEAVSALLDDLAGTDAYKWNKSFRETIDRLTTYHIAHGGKFSK